MSKEQFYNKPVYPVHPVSNCEGLDFCQDILHSRMREMSSLQAGQLRHERKLLAPNLVFVMTEGAMEASGDELKRPSVVCAFRRRVGDASEPRFFTTKGNGRHAVDTLAIACHPPEQLHD
jgi:hypothetical protein